MLKTVVDVNGFKFLTIFSSPVFVYVPKKEPEKVLQTTPFRPEDIVKQARDEESLLEVMERYYEVKSMTPNGDCGYELMCKWQKINQLREKGCSVPRSIIEEPVSPEEIENMRKSIAEMQEKLILEGKTDLRQSIGQTLIDWSRDPDGNCGRNAEVKTAAEEWLKASEEALQLHSSLIQTGAGEVFAESPEMEAFSFMVQIPLAICVPGNCKKFGTASNHFGGEKDYLVGILKVNHYYLAIPQTWIEEQLDKKADLKSATETEKEEEKGIGKEEVAKEEKEVRQEVHIAVFGLVCIRFKTTERVY